MSWLITLYCLRRVLYERPAGTRKKGQLTKSSVVLLLIKRGFQPEKGNWSLMGGFVQPDESLDQSANRILKQLTGLEGVYLEQLGTFGDPNRDPMERTVSVAYFALIDIQKYQMQL